MKKENRLFYGDCLDVLRTLESESVDLVYLDPPFNSKRDYNAFFSTDGPKDANAQITAFEDTWHWGEQAQKEYTDVLKNPEAGALGETLLPALRQFLAESDMMAYLVMMASRLVEMRRVLKPAGSLYLHCDPTASHYLKIVLDSIFGAKNFRNEIVWSYRTTLKVPKDHFGRDHDILLFYTKTEKSIFHPDRSDFPVSEKTIKRWSKYADETGFVSNKYFAGSESTIINTSDASKGFNIKMGIPRDVWDISIITGGNKEKLGYPTQKPLQLLERIIKASSNENDVVLDPFCGCGTAIHAAEKLRRKWIGIDITHLAIGLIRQRLKKAFPHCQFREEGTPKDVASARHLATGNDSDGRYQFQYWALFLAGALPAKGRKKGADSGVDGYIWFYDSPHPEAKPKKIVVSVKSGKIPANHIRELKGLLQAPVEIAVLLTLEEPSRKMKADAIAAGNFTYPNGREVPRIQILTVKDLLDGKRPDFHDYQEGSAMNKQARPENIEKGKRLELFKRPQSPL